MKKYLQVFILLMLIIFLIGCGREHSRQYKNWKNVETGTIKNDVTYRVFYISNMPCVWVSVYRDGSGNGGISCDWSKYKKMLPQN